LIPDQLEPPSDRLAKLSDRVELNSGDDESASRGPMGDVAAPRQSAGRELNRTTFWRNVATFQCLTFQKSIGPEVALHIGDPAASARTIEEHTATQAEFLDNTKQPLLAKGHAENCHVLFVDAAHFVRGAFLNCQRRLSIRGASGRRALASWELGTR